MLKFKDNTNFQRCRQFSSVNTANDIHLSLNTATVKMFADDTNFFVSGDNFDHLKKLIIAEIRSFQTWIQANKLTINYDPQKTGYCVFKPKNRILINRNRFDTDYENE